MMHTPLSLYSVGSSRQTSASELHFERSPHGTPSGWGQGPAPLEYYGRDSTQGSWASQTLGRQPLVRRHSIPTPTVCRVSHYQGQHQILTNTCCSTFLVSYRYFIGSLCRLHTCSGSTAHLPRYSPPPSGVLLTWLHTFPTYFSRYLTFFYNSSTHLLG